MKKLFIELPKHRLNISFKLIKRRKPLIENSIIPSTRDLKRYRAGNMFSRFFRYIFEHKNIKKMLGANIALMAIATNLVSAKPAQNFEGKSEAVVSASVVQLITEKSGKYPLTEVKISQGYRLFHPGVDFDGETGDVIYPIKNGVVEAVQFSRYSYGNAVLLNHGNQITSLYAHLSKIEVIEGQSVSQETVIGRVGSTGRSTGSHLHLEVRDHGLPINPLSVLP